MKVLSILRTTSIRSLILSGEHSFGASYGRILANYNIPSCMGYKRRQWTIVKYKFIIVRVK